MSGGTTEIHRDTDPLAEITHRGATGAATFYNRKYKLDAILRPGLYVENATTGAYGIISVVTGNTVEILWASVVSGTWQGETGTWQGEVVYWGDEPTWTNGDTMKVYKTAVKGQIISTEWVDLSRGWRTDPKDLIDGWRPADRDLDRDDPGHVFGPGQPENYRK